MTMKKDGIQTRNRKITRKVKKIEDSKNAELPIPTTSAELLSWPQAPTSQNLTSTPITSQNLTDSQLQQMMYYNQLGYFQ